MRQSGRRPWLASVAALALVPASAAWAQGDLELHGFVLGNLAVRLDPDQPPGPEGSRFLLAETRGRLDLGWWADEVELSAVFKGDLVHDAVASGLDVDLREGYLDYAVGRLDLRLGRQIVTWGVGDLLFINDVFPKDWVSFFSGRPLEYLKLGSDALRAHYSGRLANVEVVLTRRFRPDTLPTAERFFLFDPFGSDAPPIEQRPATSIANTEVAVRIYRRLGGLDVTAYGYRGFWRLPTFRPDGLSPPAQLTFSYSPLSVYGASVQGNMLRGVLSTEVGYYDSRQDRAGSDLAIANSQARFLLAYQRQLADNLTVGLQYYVELMARYDEYRNNLPAGFPAQPRYRDTITLRVTRMLGHDTWKLSLFAFLGVAEADYLLQPEITHLASDRFTIVGGANLFGGREATTFLGQLGRNDNVYTALRYYF